MKVYIITDERYPDYWADKDFGYGAEVDVPEDTFQRWEDAIKAYNSAQREMEEAAKKSRK